MPLLFVTAETRGGERFDQLRERTTHRFSRLPVLVLKVGAAEAEEIRAVPGLHVHVSRYDSYLPLLRHIDSACSAEGAAVLNVSISHGPGPVDPYEPVQVGTRMAAARGASFIFATGNDGPAEGSMSRWARAPWVIPVGAADAEGAALLDLSSIGTADDPASGPLVVADGTATVSLRPGELTNHGTMVALVIAGRDGARPEEGGYENVEMAGTSVAAPRVTRIVMMLHDAVNFVHSVAAAVKARLPARATTADYLLACEAVETEGWPAAPAGQLIQELPAAAWPGILSILRHGALGGFVIGVQTPPRQTDVPHVVGVLRRMLAAMARPMPGYAPHQVGHGFVSDAIAEDWLSHLSVEGFVRLLRGGGAAATAAPWGDGPAFDTALLDVLRDRRAKRRILDAPVL